MILAVSVVKSDVIVESGGCTALQALAEACKQELGSMPSSVADDERTLQASTTRLFLPA